MSRLCSWFYQAGNCLLVKEVYLTNAAKREHMKFTLAGGASYSELLRSRIFEPLNMTSSTLTSETNLFDLPTTYRWSERDQELLVLDPDLL